MIVKSLEKIILATVLFTLTLCSSLKAEINFDFGLPLFRHREVNFEKTKSADYNLQLLKKYILENDKNVISQYHVILRWFTLIKLSDTPKHSALIEAGNKYFSLEGKEKPSVEEKLRNIFYNGVLLSCDKEDDPESKKDQEFEELLLEYEEELHDRAEYWIAKGILFQALKSRPNNYFALMKPEEDLKVALTLIPRNSSYYYVLGQCFRFLGNSESSLFLAVASYEKAASLNISNPKLQNAILSIYMGLHEDYQSKGKKEPFWLEEAVYKKIIDLAPSNPYALNNLGYLYAEYGVNSQKAMDLCQQAVNHSPDNAGFQDSLGWAAFKNKRYKLAEEALLKSISLKSNVYESRYHLATLYYSTNKYKKAAEQYEKAIELRPESAEALNNLAYLYTEINAFSEKALNMAKTAIKLEPNNPSYLDTLGWAYFRNNDLDNALTYLLKADSLAPGQSEILLHIGRIYLEKNEFEKSLTYLKEAYKADSELKDPDQTLYLAVRLKSYHEALANYHGILGEKANKSKVLNILTSISKLYQEEKMFDKAIEVTKICSDLNNGEKSLKEPLFDTYELNGSEKKDKILKQDDIIVPEEDKKNENKNVSDETTVQEQSKLPESMEECSLAINFCSDFFKFLHKFFPNINELTKCNVTIIPDRLLFASKTAIIRINSNSLSGKDIKDGIFSAYYCKEADKENNTDNKHEIFFFPIGKFYCVTFDNEVYFSQKPITKENVASFSKVLPFNEDTFIQLYYDHKSFLKRLPDSISKMVKNPFEPFIRLQVSYKLTNDGIEEFTVATTGKEEDDDFVKKLAGRLFRFKLKLNKKGINVTIKMKSEKDLIFISSDFENLKEWANKKINLLSKGFQNLIPIILKVITR